ncbi:hypothetical protein Q0590_03095 [Rhodocytophaga aerolata]|uniref:SPOR domain-containing protein n=1 Tax=Rhodocytophaga aerolata TaxID=455078 RepID=A0ABT8QZF3_9BACT|nr:hypothetical protein [Rhodocytophaga aerolata]MDO1445218.1 hypothetical protein [Rhodocytophaga aerolata]
MEATNEFTHQEYLELENEKLDLESENEELASKSKIFITTTIIFAILFVLSLGYIILSEVNEPLFGKWPQVAQDNRQLKVQLSELNGLKPTIDSLVTINNTLSEQSDTQEGVFFEVQIGAFEHFNMNQYMQELARLKKEQVDTMDKYTLGKFRNFKTAQAFNNDIKKMGIADAFIVGKINGQRVELQEAVVASKKTLY